MLDTNVLISAALFPQGVCAAAFLRAAQPPCKPVVCSYILEELRRVFLEKFPHRMEAYAHFVEALALSVEVVATPQAALREESRLRDAKDRPILRAALASGVEVLLTGDKGFGVALGQPPCKGLKVLSAAEFLQMLSTPQPLTP